MRQNYENQLSPSKRKDRLRREGEEGALNLFSSSKRDVSQNNTESRRPVNDDHMGSEIGSGLVGQLKVVLFLARLDWFACLFSFVTLLR